MYLLYYASSYVLGGVRGEKRNGGSHFALFWLCMVVAAVAARQREARRCCFVIVTGTPGWLAGWLFVT